MVTNIEKINVSIAYLENKQFLCKLNNTNISLESVDYNLKNFNDINTRIKLFFSWNTNCASMLNLNKSNNTPIVANINDEFDQNQI